MNTISPGDFPTDLNVTARDHTEAMKQVIPAKRIGEKDNIAGAAIFLASRAGNFNLGSNLVVDGGESVRGYSAPSTPTSAPTGCWRAGR